MTAVSSVPNTGNVLIDSLTWGSKWDFGSGPKTLTVSYYTDAPDKYHTPNAKEIGAIQSVLATVSSMVNINFNFLGAVNTLDPDISFDFPKGKFDGLLGFANPPGEGEVIPNKSFIHIFSDDYVKKSALTQGSYDYITFVHEFLHSLGLAHPHDDGGTSTDPSSVFPGVTGPSGSYGDFGLNQGVYTTMSYNSGWPVGAPMKPTSGSGFEYTPMALDILALQSIYGANTNSHGGDDGYTLPGKKGTGVGFSCIWDTGGSDSIIGAAKAENTINLNAATGVYGEGAGGYVSSAKGVAGGFTIAHGVVIENAFGGTKHDTLIGNSGDNTLVGRGGQDTMTGGAGIDYFLFENVKDSAKLSSADFITDFAHGVDKIDLHLLDANTKVAGDQAFSFMGDVAGFTGAAQVLVQHIDGDTIIACNNNTNTKGEMYIKLAGYVSLTADDFIL